MNKLKLDIELIPKGAWGNNLRTLLSKKDWDVLREECYKKANYKCEICGFATEELDAHEVWEFDINTKTQTLVDIIALCSKCHGVKHIRNSERLGYGDNAKKHFMNVNNCDELQFASRISKAQLDFEHRNRIYRWKVISNLDKFRLKNIEIKQRNIPFINNPYENVDWERISYSDAKRVFKINRNDNILGAPKVVSILVDNYQGIIAIESLFTDKIEWYLDNVKIKTKYNVIGPFFTTLKVENLYGKSLNFKLLGIGGETISKTFEILPQEVL